MTTILRQLFCRHRDLTFERNIYGDGILHNEYKRSLWRCDRCRKWIAKDTLYVPLNFDVVADMVIASVLRGESREKIVAAMKLLYDAGKLDQKMESKS